jgi:hypothetical protein
LVRESVFEADTPGISSKVLAGGVWVPEAAGDIDLESALESPLTLAAAEEEDGNTGMDMR